MARRPASSARAAPTRRCCMYQELADMACNRITAGITRRSWGRGRSRRCSTPTTRPARPRTSASHVEAGSLGTSGPPPRPRQLGRARQRLGSGVVPRRRVASARRGLHEEPQPRARGAVPLRLGDARYLPDFIVLVDDGHGRTTCCTWWSRSRATGARTPRRRSRRWRRTGCPVSTI